MRKLKVDFLEKKLSKLSNKNIVEISTFENVINVNDNNFVNMFPRFLKYIKDIDSRTYIIENLLFLDNCIYDKKNNLYIATYSEVLKILELDQDTLNKVSQEIIIVIGQNIINVDDTIEQVRTLINEVRDYDLDRIVKKNLENGFDVVKIKDINKLLEFNTNEEVNLKIIPFRNFLASVFDEGKIYKDTIGVFTFSFSRLDKENVDEVLFDVVKEYSKKVVGKEFQEIYNHFYDDIFHHNEVFYLCQVSNIGINIPVVSLIFGKNIEFNNETPMIKAITNILIKFYKKVSEIKDGGEIEISTVEPIFKNGSWKVESRRPSFVRSHIRHYKSGIATIVRPHTRLGTNTKLGICVTI